MNREEAEVITLTYRLQRLIRMARIARGAMQDAMETIRKFNASHGSLGCLEDEIAELDRVIEATDPESLQGLAYVLSRCPVDFN